MKESKSSPFFKLNKFSKNITSQGGEDGIIEYIIKTSKTPIYKTCVEFGAHDGIQNSNTYNLWKNKNFKALLIESDKNRYKDLVNNVLDNKNVLTKNEFVNSIGSNSLKNIIDRINFINSKEVGVLSIDIDSFDYHVLKNLNIKPQIIIIEFNNSIPGYIEYSDLEDNLFLRCSAKSIQNLGFELGYKSVACTVTNVILLRSDCFDPKFHPNLPVEYLIDYENMHKNNDYLYTVIHSQVITTYPIFTKPLHAIDKFYFRLTRRLYSLFRIRKERYIYPNNKTKSNLIKSGLFY